MQFVENSCSTIIARRLAFSTISAAIFPVCLSIKILYTDSSFFIFTHSSLPQFPFFCLSLTLDIVPIDASAPLLAMINLGQSPMSLLQDLSICIDAVENILLHQLYVIRSCKIQRRISNIGFVRLLCFSRRSPLHFDIVIVTEASVTTDSKYPTVVFSTWVYEFSRGETTSSCFYFARKIERSARWSSRKGDEARDWQRKCVKRVPRFGSHSDDTSDTRKCQREHLRNAIFKNFPFYSPSPLSRSSVDVDISNPARLACMTLFYIYTYMYIYVFYAQHFLKNLT